MAHTVNALPVNWFPPETAAVLHEYVKLVERDRENIAKDPGRYRALDEA